MFPNVKVDQSDHDLAVAILSMAANRLSVTQEKLIATIYQLSICMHSSKMQEWGIGNLSTRAKCNACKRLAHIERLLLECEH